MIRWVDRGSSQSETKVFHIEIAKGLPLHYVYMQVGQVGLAGNLRSYMAVCSEHWHSLCCRLPVLTRKMALAELL